MTLQKLNAFGIHRVIDPRGAMPQAAWKLDNTPTALENEILCEVEMLNIDSASFAQIRAVCNGDAQQIADHIAATVRERGKQHNLVTGSGGMFTGSVLEIGAALRGSTELRVGDRIASLVSLTLTPLYLESIEHVSTDTAHVRVHGKAILFESASWAKLPAGMDSGVALAVLDVAGAAAQVRRLVKPGMTVVVIGAAGKSGIFACAQARDQLRGSGRIIAAGRSAGSDGARLLIDRGYADAFVEADAREALTLADGVALHAPQLGDLVINCVNVAGTEMGSILCAKEGGIVYFFSMATSFTAAALGAEGVGKDVTMIIGNGYAKDHAAIALQTLRDHPEIAAYFGKRYAHRQLARNPS